MVCLTHSTSDYGSTKIENTNFQYPWGSLPSGTTRINVFIKGNREANVILAPTPGGIPDDVDGDEGYPKIGEFYLPNFFFFLLWSKSQYTLLLSICCIWRLSEDT